MLHAIRLKSLECPVDAGGLPPTCLAFLDVTPAILAIEPDVGGEGRVTVTRALRVHFVGLRGDL